MRLLRVGELGRERPIVLDDDGNAFELRPSILDLDGEFFANAGVELVGDALLRGSLRPVDISRERIGAPVARPGAVICIGLNYGAHAAEAGSPIPESPVVFLQGAEHGGGTRR